jgi:GntR family transcriptional regulator/MocR family aminotransferase
MILLPVVSNNGVPFRLPIDLHGGKGHFRTKGAVQLVKGANRSVTLSGKICDAIKGQIASGIYLPGSTLPSSRALAEELGVSRSTVTVAFEQLAAEGYVEMSQGSRPRVPRSVQRAKAPEKRPRAKVSIEFSEFAKRLQSFTPADRLAGLKADFRAGDISGMDFPKLSWRKAMINALHIRPKALKYGDPLGSLELRKSLRAYMWRSRGIRCDEQQIVVVNGSQQGIDLCARIFLDAGDSVVVEDPGYVLARHAFEAIGARIVPIPVDRDGMQTSLLEGVVAKLAYVTPSHQFPLGGILPVGRRQELLKWATHAGAFLVEDDYDGEFRYDTKPTETLHSLDTNGRVIYLGTVSKTLSPELRLGYLVVPHELMSSFALAKRLTDRHSALLQQRTLHVFVENGGLERHIRRARRINGKRRATLLSELQRMLGDRGEVAGEAAGLHIVLWLNGIGSELEDGFVAKAGEQCLGLYGITPFYADKQHRHTEPRAGFVMGYAALGDTDIRRGIHLLRRLLDGLRG